VLTHFTFIEPNGQTVRTLLSQFELAMMKKTIRFVLIDPWNSIMREGKGDNVYAHDTKWAPVILNFTHRANINTWLNIHTTTYARRKQEESGPHSGLTAFPGRYDVEQGAVWNNKADAFLIGHRYTKHPDPNERYQTRISVGKIKDTETGGEPHAEGDYFSMRLNYMSYFTCSASGERAFEPITPNLSEV